MLVVNGELRGQIWEIGRMYGLRGHVWETDQLYGPVALYNAWRAMRFLDLCEVRLDLRVPIE
jgi:hypothetical protein